MNRIALTWLAAAWTGVAQAAYLTPVKDQPSETGALVLQVLPESPASKAGIKSTDLITAVGGTAVAGCSEFVRAVASSPGTTVITHRRGADVLETPVTLGDTATGRPRLGVRCPLPNSHVVFVNGNTLNLLVETTPDATLVHVTVINDSSTALQVSPEMITMADVSNSMLKRVDPAVAIAALGKRNAAAAAAATAVAPTESSTSPLAKSALSFALGRLGIDQMAAGLASDLAEGALSKKPATGIAAPAPTPAIPKIDALVTAELEPKFSANGVVFFEPTPGPVTVMINLGGQKTTLRFDAPRK